MDEPDWVRPTDFPRLRGQVGFDFETVDPTIKTRGPSWAFPGVGKVIGVGISMEDGFRAYYPVAHEIGNMSDPQKVWRWLKHELETDPDPTLELIVYNWTYEMGWLRRYGIRPRCPVYDPMVAMSLVDECRLGYSLNSVAKTVLRDAKVGDDLAKFAEQLGVKDHMSKLDKLPPMYVGPYCEQDSDLARRLWDPLLGMIDERNMRRVLDLEHAVLEPVLDMRFRGIRINESRLQQKIEECQAREKEISDEIRDMVGRGVEVWAQDSIADAMALVGIDFPLTAQGRPSFTANWLESHPHRFPQLIVAARQANKLWSTFLQNYFVDNLHDGRVHCTFTPLRSDEGGAVTGRFSSSSPSFQNLPARKGDAARVVRGNLLAEEDGQWAALDYSSQEPRLTVHFAVLAGCTGAETVMRRYQENPRTDYHQFVADLTDLPRKRAKDINLGLPYGMGGAKFCKVYLDLPTRWAVFRPRMGAAYFRTREEAAEYCHANSVDRQPVEVAGAEGQALLDQYHKKLPYTKSLMEKTEQVAKNRGYIITLLGRRRQFIRPTEKVSAYNRKKAFPYKALNCLIQGSGADQNKQAMVDLYREGFMLLVTLHDELGLSVADEKEARRAAEIMENCVTLKVPSVVDVEIGDSWAASMGLPDEDA